MVRFIRSLLALFLLLLLAAVPAGATAIEDANSILEKWTSFHWGKDCFVWIAHYSDELVDPWVQAESEKRGMSAQEAEQYRTSFTEQLRMTDSEAFLFSVYFFGDDKLDLSPFAKNISLRTDDGNEYGPTSYDHILDNPLLPGVVQGLVFFSRQEQASFSLVVRGLGISDEMVFPFPVLRGASGHELPAKEDMERKPVTRGKVIVLPTTTTPESEPTEDLEDKAEKPGEILQETEVPPNGNADRELAGYEDKSPVAEQEASGEKDGLSKEQVITLFLQNWVSGDYKGMYDLLSSASRGKYSLNAFTASAMQSPYRLVLQGGYDLRWIDNTSVEVIARADLMIMSTLKKRVFRMVETGDVWRITW